MKTSELIYINLCNPDSWKQIFTTFSKYGGIFLLFIDAAKSAEYMIVMNSLGSIIATLLEVFLKNSIRTDNKIDNILESISTGFNEFKK